MRCAAIGAALAVLSSSGCAISSDLIYLAVGPGESPTLSGTALPVDPGESTREVRLDREHGLVCSYMDSPRVRGSSVEMETVFPNGIAPMMWIATGLEGVIFGPAVAIGDKAFRSPWFLVPLGLDLSWGLYRSITIKPEIRHMTLVKSGDGTTRILTLKTSCPPGTEVDLFGSGETLHVHVAMGGWLEPSELGDLIAFLERHPTAISVGTGTRLDLALAADLLAAARTRAASGLEARAHEKATARRERDEPAVVAVVAPPIPKRALIRWQLYGPPQVYGVVVDFPLAALCRSDATCPPGQHCADRGDGVPLCLGPGAPHPFCAVPTDCSAGFCARRPDGVGMCAR
jgi:hypothetical protein